MKKLEKKWRNALFHIAPQVNFQIIEYLGYSPVKIIIKIQLLIFVKRKIQIDLFPTQLKVPINEQVFSFM